MRVYISSAPNLKTPYVVEVPRHIGSGYNATGVYPYAFASKAAAQAWKNRLDKWDAANGENRIGQCIGGPGTPRGGVRVEWDDPNARWVRAQEATDR